MPLFPVCTVPRCSGKMNKVVRDQVLPHTTPNPLTLTLTLTPISNP